MYLYLHRKKTLCIRALLCLPPTFLPWLIKQEAPPTLWLSQQLWRGRTQPWHQPSTLERLAYVTEASGTEGDGAILPQSPDTEPPPFLASQTSSHVVGSLVSCLRDQVRLFFPVPASQVDLDAWNKGRLMWGPDASTWAVNKADDFDSILAQFPMFISVN